MVLIDDYCMIFRVKFSCGAVAEACDCKRDGCEFDSHLGK